jgi:hypothetical protein
MTDLSLLQKAAKAVRLFGSNVTEVARFVRSKVHRQFVDRLDAPVFGDLVFEVTSAFRDGDEAHFNAVGYLLQLEDDEALIQRLDGVEERWRNSLFYAVPRERTVGEAEEMAECAREFAAIGSIPPINHFAKVVRRFGVSTYAKMISMEGRTYDMYQRMTYPRPGDLVFEYTTAFRSEDAAHIDAVGFLIEKTMSDVSGASEDVVRILTLDGREMSWSNATFLAIPADRKIEKQPPEELYLTGDN